MTLADFEKLLASLHLGVLAVGILILIGLTWLVMVLVTLKTPTKPGATLPKQPKTPSRYLREDHPGWCKCANCS